MLVTTTGKPGVKESLRSGDSGGFLLVDHPCSWDRFESGAENESLMHHVQTTLKYGA